MGLFGPGPEDGELFVFAGQLYRRDPPPGFLPWLSRTTGALLRGLRPFPSSSSTADGDKPGSKSVTVGISVLFLVAALVTLASVSPSGQRGLPKLSEAGLRLLSDHHSKDSDGKADISKSTQGQSKTRTKGDSSKQSGETLDGKGAPKKILEGKGEEERVQLASQLKSLSAVMSAGRASNQDESTSPATSGSSSGSAHAPSLSSQLHQALVAVKQLLEDEQVSHAYGMQQSLRSLDEKLTALEKSGSQRVTEKDLSFLREGGRKLAEEAEESNKRSPIPPSAYGRLFGLHRKLLSTHESGLERVVVPRMAYELRAVVLQSPALVRKLGPAVENLVQLPASQMIHEFINLSLALKEADESDPQVLAARSYLSHFASVADELLAAKVLLRVCISMAELDNLVEGHKLSKKVFAAHQAATRLWPESLVNTSELPSERTTTDASGAPVAAIVQLHLSVRREQYRRLRLPSASIHDHAAWSHLVNACEELSSLAFSAPGELQFGNSATTFVSVLRDLVDDLSERASNWGQPALQDDTTFRFDNLIMEADLTYQKTELDESRNTVKLLRRATKESRIVQAIHLHIARLVQDLIPGALVAVSVGSPTGKSVAATNSETVSEADVIVCFVLDNQSGPSQQLTFARTELPPRVQTMLFQALQHLELSDCLVELDAVPQLSQEDRQFLSMQANVIDEINPLSNYAIITMPERFEQIVSEKTLTSEAARKLLSDKLTPDIAESAALLVDPLALRLKADDQFMRYFPATHKSHSPPRMVVCALLPDVLTILAESTRTAESAARKLA